MQKIRKMVEVEKRRNKLINGEKVENYCAVIERKVKNSKKKS